MKKGIIGICILLVGGMGLYAQSALNRKEFTRHWIVESESPDYQLTFLNDTVEITAPKGFTLWRKEKMKGDVVIEYDACVMNEREGDRLSDLNCFWMATDPNEKDIWKRLRWRNGNFDRCYSLQLYYLGYGGNHNSTTRFRRYEGDYEAFLHEKKRPQILTEYTDSDHLLQKGKWYHIRIANSRNKVTYTINGEQIVDFRDPQPFTEGWFGFRTTVARVRITNFRYTTDSRY